MTIKTKPTTQEYRDNWDAIFGTKQVPSLSQPTVRFISQIDMETKVEPSKEVDVISIVDPDSPPAKFKDEDFKRVLRLYFDDISEDYIGSILDKRGMPDIDPRGNVLWHGFVMADGHHAKEILEFIRSSTARHLIVHCHAGISRSAAIALFAASNYNYKLLCGKYDASGANPRLLRLLKKAYDGTDFISFEYGDDRQKRPGPSALSLLTF